MNGLHIYSSKLYSITDYIVKIYNPLKMSTSTPLLPPNTKIWTKGAYLISTDVSLIPLQTLNEWFASDDLYWTKPLPLDILQQTLQNSLCFGLYYHTPESDQQNNNNDNGTANSKPNNIEFIGIARCITDHTTFIYLTDVYVHSSHQGKGLGSWLVECVGEVIDTMPYLRRSMLLTRDWVRSVPFYKKILGVSVHESTSGEGMAIMMRKGRGHP